MLDQFRNEWHKRSRALLATGKSKRGIATTGGNDSSLCPKLEVLLTRNRGRGVTTDKQLTGEEDDR